MTTYHRRLNAEVWTEESLDGVDIHDIRAVSWGPNRIDLVARGAGDAVCHRWWDGEQWHPSIGSGWDSLSGNFYQSRPPTVVSWGPNRLDVFVVAGEVEDAQGRVFHRWWDGITWQPQSDA